MNKLERFAPVGHNSSRDLTLFSIGLAIATLFSLSYLISLFNDIGDVNEKMLRTMPPFVDVLGPSFFFFAVLIPITLCYIYIYYNEQISSRYLLRRLPDRWAMVRRTVGLPLICVGVTLTVWVALFWIYYALYQICVPSEYLVDGQLAILWNNWTNGGTL